MRESLKMPPDLLLLCATEGEATRLAERIASPEISSHVGKRTISGEIEGVPCRLTATGIGMTNAAAELTHQIDARRPWLVLQFGIAGAYRGSGLAVGEIAFADEEIYGEAGVLTPEGWLPADVFGFPLVPGDPPRFNRFPCDERLVARAAELCGAKRGAFLTLSQCTGVSALGEALFQRFGAMCESMEGAAAAHVCALHNVPFLEVRGASNMVEDRDRSKWRIPLAASAAQEAVLTILRKGAAIAELLPARDGERESETR
jgi:futalosine hydrolase